MKVSIGEYAVISLDAPTLTAYEVLVRNRIRWRVWCKQCRLDHLNGPGEGHREACCSEESSPYLRTGYNLALGSVPHDDGDH